MLKHLNVLKNIIEKKEEYIKDRKGKKKTS